MNVGLSIKSKLVKLSLTAGVVVGLTLSTVASSFVFADTYPEKPITLVVPFPVGGSTDIAGRLLAKHMTETLGQPVVIENRTGASGAIGIQHVTRAEPDGYTLGVSGVGTSMLLKIIGKKISFDPQEDLDFIAHMGSFSFLIAGRNDLGLNSIDEVISYAKKHPGELTYGSSGVGTPGYLFMEALKYSAGIDILHIPYKGSTPLMNDVMGGHVDIGMLAMAGSIDQVKSGAIKAIAITGSERSKVLPNVAIVSESKSITLQADIWNLLVAPKGTPKDIAVMLNNAAVKAMQDPEVIATLEKYTLSTQLFDLQEISEFTQSEYVKWSDMAAISGVKK
jgi:tripartite-type tricarboxylate transporter receptor subunit TctC